MKTVWKFPLPGVENMIDMPAGAQPLSVDLQAIDGKPMVCLWALVDPAAEKTIRWFQVVGTGHVELGDGPAQFVGSAQAMAVNDGTPSYLVLHVFDTTPQEA